jgi:DNA-directed RNA polymerase specialized sigma24 family protein
MKKGELKVLSEADMVLVAIELEYYQKEAILDKLISEDLRGRIDDAVQQLPRQQQQVFKLIRFDGLSSKCRSFLS